MPRRGEVPSSWWSTNPLQGLDPHEQYEAIRWGNRPRRETVVEAPMRKAQHLVELGKLQVLFVGVGSKVAAIKFARPYPVLAVGALDNRLYIPTNKTLRAMAKRRAFGAPGQSLPILQVDYLANKGGETVYWWHAHEAPYPRLRVLASGLPVYAGGAYKVAPEGIVG